MFTKIFTSAILFCFFLPSSFAMKTNYKDFKIDDTTIHTEVPQGWTTMQGYLNVPLTLVSQKGKQDIRSVVEIIPYGQKDEVNGLVKIRKDPEEYYAQKERWLSKMNGQSMRYLPFEDNSKNGAVIYSVGIKYKTPLGEFMDKTYYVSTKSKHLYFIKAMVPLDMLNEQSTVVSELVDTFSAKN